MVVAVIAPHVRLLRVGLIPAVGYVQLGAWVFSITCGAAVLWRTNAFATKYQRQVANTIRPLSSRARRQLVRGAKLDLYVYRVERLTPPRELMGRHETIVGTMREVIRGYDAAATPVNLAHQASVAVTRHEQLDANLKCNSEDPHSITYVEEVNKQLAMFNAGRSGLVDKQLAYIEAAVGALRTIVPPRRLATAHTELILCLEEWKDIVYSERAYIRVGEQAGVKSAANALVDVQRRIALSISEIRSWRWLVTARPRLR